MGGQRVAGRRLKTLDMISEEEMNVSNKDQDNNEEGKRLLFGGNGKLEKEEHKPGLEKRGSRNPLVSPWLRPPLYQCRRGLTTALAFFQLRKGSVKPPGVAVARTTALPVSLWRDHRAGLSSATCNSTTTTGSPFRAKGNASETGGATD